MSGLAAALQIAQWAWRTAHPIYPPAGLDADAIYQWVYWPTAVLMSLPLSLLAFLLFYFADLIWAKHRARRDV